MDWASFAEVLPSGLMIFLRQGPSGFQERKCDCPLCKQTSLNKWYIYHTGPHRIKMVFLQVLKCCLSTCLGTCTSELRVQ